MRTFLVGLSWLFLTWILGLSPAWGLASVLLLLADLGLAFRGARAIERAAAAGERDGGSEAQEGSSEATPLPADLAKRASDVRRRLRDGSTG